MFNKQQTEEFGPRFQVMRIIATALILGPLLMSIVVLIARNAPKFTKQFGPIEWLAIGIAAACFLGSLVIPTFARSNVLKPVRDNFDKKERKALSSELLGKLTIAYQSTLIIRLALIENGLVSSMLLWFMNGSIYCLPGIAIGFLLLIVNFPIYDRVVLGIENLFEIVKNDD